MRAATTLRQLQPPTGASDGFTGAAARAPRIMAPRLPGRGACVTHPDPDLWFTPSPHETGRAPADAAWVKILAAKAICDRCPIRHPCLAWALMVSEPHGIWGGLTAVERGALQRRRGSRNRKDGAT